MRALADRWIRPELGEAGMLRPGRWLLARGLVWMAVLIGAIVLAYVPGVQAISHGLPPQSALKFAVRLGGVLAALGVYAALVRVGEGRGASEIAPAAAPAGLLSGFATGAMLFAAVMAILVGAGLYDFVRGAPAPVWRAAGLAMEAGVLEELIVRGVILRLLWRGFGPWPAFAASAMLFGAGHIGNPGATFFSAACVAIEAGIMLASFYALTGRLWVSIGVHAGWNFTQGHVFGAAVSGGDFGVAMARSTARAGHPEWLTGGAFGPEASLPALFVCTAAGVAVLWMARRAGRFGKPPASR